MVCAFINLLCTKFICFCTSFETLSRYRYCQVKEVSRIWLVLPTFFSASHVHFKVGKEGNDRGLHLPTPPARKEKSLARVSQNRFAKEMNASPRLNLPNILFHQGFHDLPKTILFRKNANHPSIWMRGFPSRRYLDRWHHYAVWITCETKQVQSHIDSYNDYNPVLSTNEKTPDIMQLHTESSINVFTVSAIIDIVTKIITRPSSKIENDTIINKIILQKKSLT